MHSLCRWLLVLCLACPAMAEDDGVRRNDKGERLWELNSYLKGTAAEIHRTLYRETDRFNAQLAELTRVLEDDRRIARQHEEAALASLRERADYIRLQAEARDLKDKLDKSRTAGDRSETIRLSSQYNNAREAAGRMERDAIKALQTDRLTRGDFARLADNERKLATLQKGLNDAEKWRDYLVDSIRNGFWIKYPPKPGKIGILKTVTPTQYRASGEVLVSCKLQELLERLEENAEGVAVVRQQPHWVMVLIEGSGLTEKAAPVEHETLFDRSVEVIRSKIDAVSGQPVIVVKVRPDDDVDQLMKALRP